MRALLVTWWMPLLLCVVSGVLLAARRVSTRAWRGERVVWAALLVLALGVFSRGGAWMEIHPHDANCVHHERKVYLHFHEVWHYWVGARYYPELGYDGLYEAFLLADVETVGRMKTRAVRDLSDVLRTVPREEALARARARVATAFTPARWEAFKADYRTLASVAPDAWLDVGVMDAGFNPSPGWCVLGTPVANALPLSLGLPFLDVALLLLATALLHRAFGLRGTVAWLLAYLLSYVSAIGWTSGSFLRMPWLAALVAALACLRLGRTGLAGALLGFATLSLVFPGAFAVGAGLWLLADTRRRGDAGPLVRFVLGGLLTAGVVFALSVAMFGLDAWAAFLDHILRHARVDFVKHLGLRKVVLFDPSLAGQDFHGVRGLARFREWNVLLAERWDALRPVVLPGSLVVTGWAAWASPRVRLEEAALLVGFTLVFLFQAPANYYFVFLAILPAVLMGPVDGDGRPPAAPPAGPSADGAFPLRHDALLVLAFFASWGLHRVFHPWRHDDIIEFHDINVVTLAFLLGWLALRTWPSVAVRLGRRAA